MAVGVQQLILQGASGRHYFVQRNNSGSFEVGENSSDVDGNPLLFGFDELIDAGPVPYEVRAVCQLVLEFDRYQELLDYAMEPDDWAKVDEVVASFLKEWDLSNKDVQVVCDSLFDKRPA